VAWYGGIATGACDGVGEEVAFGAGTDLWGIAGIGIWAGICGWGVAGIGIWVGICGWGIARIGIWAGICGCGVAGIWDDGACDWGAVDVRTGFRG
jgi:hypothetical protein